MIKLRVPDMTCSHCSQAVTKAVLSAAPAARVSVDLERKLVTVESGTDTRLVADAIVAAGFSVEPAAAV